MTDTPTPSGEARRPARPAARRLRRALIGAGVLAALLVVYVVGTFIQVWHASGRDGARDAGAIVVLGAAQYNGRPSPVLKNRLDHAYDLWDLGFAPIIVVTGGRQEGDTYTEATTGYNYLRDLGVPDSAIRKEVQGTTTYESLAAVARFLRTEGIDDVILVSGPAHSKRLAGIAPQVGLDAAISPSDGSASFQQLSRETVAVSLGRLIGYRRLDRIDH